MGAGATVGVVAGGGALLTGTRRTASSRTCSVTGSGTGFYLEPANSNREDNIWVFDVRAEKTATLHARMRLRMFLDLFNLANSHASETISRATGTGYQRPAAILAPRTARVGFRFIF